MMQKVTPGQPFKVRAADWNAIADTVNAFKADQLTETGAGQSAGISAGIVRVYNGGNAHLPAYTVVALGALSKRMNYATDGATATPIAYYTAEPVTDAAAAYGVTQEAIAPGAVGRVMVAGITPALFNGETTEAYASPAVDAAGAMQGGGASSARILAHPTADNLYGVILLGCGGGGGGSATHTPQPFELRTGTQQIGGQNQITLEVYLPAGACFYADVPAPEQVGSAPNVAARPEAANVSGNWYVWKAFNASATAAGTLLLDLRALTYGSTEAREYALYSRDDAGNLYRENSAAGTSTADSVPGTAPLIEIGAYRVVAGVATVDQLRVGPFRASFCSGGEGLYTSPPLGGDDTARDSLIFTRVEEGASLSADAWLWWLLLPMGAIFDGGGAVCRGYAIDWPEIPLAYTFNRLRAVTHAALHFSTFVPLA